MVKRAMKKAPQESKQSYISETILFSKKETESIAEPLRSKFISCGSVAHAIKTFEWVEVRFIREGERIIARGRTLKEAKEYFLNKCGKNEREGMDV